MKHPFISSVQAKPGFLLELIERYESYKMVFGDDMSEEPVSSVGQQSYASGLSWDFSTMRLTHKGSIGSGFGVTLFILYSDFHWTNSFLG